MLEQRPLTRKMLAGAGAFAFVFTAAMAGTGVMMTGGLVNDGIFQGGDVDRIAPSRVVDPITVQMASWQPEDDYSSGYAYAPSYRDRTAQVQQTSYTIEDVLAAHRDAARRAEMRGDEAALTRHARTEAAIERDIDALYRNVYADEPHAQDATAETDFAATFAPEPSTPEFDTTGTPDSDTLETLSDENVPTKKT